MTLRVAAHKDLYRIIADAQQAIRYADKFGAVKLEEYELEVLQNAVEEHIIRKAKERDPSIQ